MAEPSNNLDRHHTRPRGLFDPNFLPRYQWLSRKDTHLWRAGVHPDQIVAQQGQEENDEDSVQSYEDLSGEQTNLMLQHDLYCEAISLKYDRKDKSTRLFFSTQIKLIDHKFKLAMTGAQISTGFKHNFIFTLL
ncbi:hypothetical protein sscle_05g040780 [Sclerotinia sclerotiorum 1980 UF-70]|uniref:Uncharacterized protein n=1 Tax=Sclerotinia sclerotiorum (strain ATCC 18683 / 1980 / Ss-1) TaxID=665079 RepID=A0A1D9Q2Y3_SCLS1|nr:hypothetical protein sscle_05g040780 [Sclerotinia sclerotiorum 1980 UF-70]